jgi:hypothetical protein
MRRHLIPSLAQIDLRHPVGVQWVALIGVNNHNKEARISMDKLSLVTRLQVPENRSIIKKGQVDHILYLFKLRRVDLSNFRALVSEFLMAHSNHTLASRIFRISRLQETFTVSLSLRIRDPHRLLGIIYLVLVSPFHFNGRNKELRRIRVYSSLGEFDMAWHLGSCN